MNDRPFLAESSLSPMIAFGQDLPSKSRKTAISNREQKMIEEFSYVWLLPLLEKPLETAALDFPDAVRALGEKHTLPADIALQPLVITALTSHPEYWPGLALKWLEDGFPMDVELTAVLAHCVEDKTLSQSDRHRARRLVGRKRTGN
ncbi:hypothetical protein [Pseudomonas yamanorum]|uniref:Uncharacterized protein n=1 Tax=Pseudomonas yamanorum TaxID=515393 RepID=A0AAJ3H8R1_9PSED|nr:hypothetical protein [Pseudomonas yamanorum]NWD45373.1 hypothetical protein [Pseudomonas yamanorum]